METVDFARFDALNEAQAKGIEIELLDPTGKPIGMKWGTVGPDSERMRKAIAQVTKDFAEAAASRESLAEAPVDDGDRRMRAVLAKAATHWTANPIINGEVVEFSEEAALDFLERYPLFADQIQAQATRRLSFFRD